MKKLLTILLIGAVILIVGVIFILSLLGIFKSTSSNGSSNNPPQEQQDNSNGLSVSMNNFAFNPETLTINRGETVTWTNKDSASHDIVGDTFESTLLKNGETFSFTFNNPGTFEYTCGIHPPMKGTIIVR